MAELVQTNIMREDCEETTSLLIVQDSDILPVRVSNPTRRPNIANYENLTIARISLSEDLSVGEGAASSTHATSPSHDPELFFTCMERPKYFSTRIERLTQIKSEYATALNFEIDCWSELTPDRAVTVHGEHPNAVGEEGKQLIRTKSELEVFEILRKQWPGFFDHWRDGGKWKVGKKIGEGGQAEIFEARCSNYPDRKFVLKVFKEGSYLRDLQEQWPLGMLKKSKSSASMNVAYFGSYSCTIFGGMLLENGRFAFLMSRYWGDLRKLIKLRKSDKLNQDPPFQHDEAKKIIEQITDGMKGLHEDKVLHRDLKASNVLIYSQSGDNFDPMHDTFCCIVADYECSVGVLGTGFWRAPEILRALKERPSSTSPLPLDLFTESSDVYSFAMTCYEIVTGLIPFEGILKATDYGAVIGGKRPTLPKGLEPWIQKLMERCWHPEPSSRPAFKEINDYIVYGHWDEYPQVKKSNLAVRKKVERPEPVEEPVRNLKGNHGANKEPWRRTGSHDANKEPRRREADTRSYSRYERHKEGKLKLIPSLKDL